MDLSKFSTEDLQALKAGDLSAMSTEGLLELKRLQTPPSVAEQNLADLDNQGPVDEVVGAGKAALNLAKKAGTATKAGFSGLADLVAGNGLDKAAENVAHVEKGEDVTSAPAVWGEAVGSQFTPGQMAAQATLGKVAEMIGPWAASVMKGWSEGAARMAIGATTKVCKAIGISDLSSVAQFLLKPITFGEQTFAPIITATSTPDQMLAAAETIKRAAGKELEGIAASANGAIKTSIDEALSGPAMNDAKVMMDVPKLQKQIQALSDDVSLKRLGKGVIAQYDDALADLNDVVTKALSGDSKTVFSDLAKAKTSLGDLIYKHGNMIESKAALQDVYKVVSEMLNDTAERVGGDTATKYAAANDVYSKVTTVVEALKGKVLSNAAAGSGLRAFLNDPAALIAGLGIGHASGPLGLVTGPTAFLATKGAETYGPQMIAAGLNKAAPLVSGALKVTAAGVPVLGRAIYDGLTLKQADQDQ